MEDDGTLRFQSSIVTLQYYNHYMNTIYYISYGTYLFYIFLFIIIIHSNSRLVLQHDKFIKTGCVHLTGEICLELKVRVIYLQKLVGLAYYHYDGLCNSLSFVVSME